MLQPTVGHEIDTNENEQGGEQMPIPACCDAQKRDNRSEVPQDALGAFHEQREPPRTLHRYAMEQKTERAEVREKLRIGSAALRPLCARCPLLCRRLPFIARQVAVLHSISHQPNPPASILACT